MATATATAAVRLSSCAGGSIDGQAIFELDSIAYLRAEIALEHHRLTRGNALNGKAAWPGMVESLPALGGRVRGAGGPEQVRELEEAPFICKPIVSTASGECQLAVVSSWLRLNPKPPTTTDLLYLR